MLKTMIKMVADATSLSTTDARTAVGIVLNTAERQGSALAEEIFTRMPGARTLSATTGAELGASTDMIARLIEQTPGGRRHVGEGMFTNLHRAGLGHAQIARLLPTMCDYMRMTYGLDAFGHLGDLVVADMLADLEKSAIAA